MKIYVNSLDIICIEPEEGYLLKKGDFTYKKIFLSKSDKAELYTEVIDKDYIYTEKPQEEVKPANDLASIKKELIELSKANLHDYLEANPMYSTIKNKKGKYYNITITKQSLLADTISAYKIANEIGIDYKLYWNSTGEISEEWTIQEAMLLLIEIKNHIAPIVHMQQCIEQDIKSAATLEELKNIDINCTKFNIDLYTI